MFCISISYESYCLVFKATLVRSNSVVGLSGAWCNGYSCWASSICGQEIRDQVWAGEWNDLGLEYARGGWQGMGRLVTRRVLMWGLSHGSHAGSHSCTGSVLGPNVELAPVLPFQAMTWRLGHGTRQNCHTVHAVLGHLPNHPEGSGQARVISSQSYATIWEAFKFTCSVLVSVTCPSLNVCLSWLGYRELSRGTQFD